MPPSSVSTLAFIAMAPFVGSFLGTLTMRLPNGQNVIWGRSCCSHCGQPLRPRELVPVASWILQRGRCAMCSASLTWFYPAIELAALAIAIWAASLSRGAPFYYSCLLGWLLLPLAAIDIQSYRVSNVLTASLAVAGISANLALMANAFWAHCVGAIAGGVALWGVAGTYRLIRGRDGLGFGDAKLFAAAGIWVGWQGLVSVMLTATLAALTSVAISRTLGAQLRPDTKIPFGPFLALGLWLTWLYGPLQLF
jgi:leader peptidase (prepilin peptidase) / N-methyltransferase